MKKGGFNCFRTFLWLLIFISAILCAMQYNHGEKTTKNIVILNSYHKGLTWTDEQTNGILNALNQYHNDLSISVEYMDWKRYPTEENINNIYTQLEYKYSNQKIDLILTTDDAALDFALKHRHAIFSDAPIVFSGVNEKDALRLLREHQKVTGVVEKVDPDQTIALALKINPKIKEVYVIYDNTESGLSTGELTIEAIRRINPEIKIKTYNDKPFNELLSDVAHAPKDSIVLITTYYST